MVTGSLRIPSANTENNWLRVVQAHQTILELSVDNLETIHFSVATTLSPAERHGNHILLDFELSPSSLASAGCGTTPIRTIPSTNLIELTCTPLAFDMTSKFKFLDMARREYDRAACAVDEDARTMRDFLVASLLNSKPVSVIRLGDGEGRLLGFPELFNVHEIIAECLNYQFGPGVFDELRSIYGGEEANLGAAHLRNMLNQSIKDADIVCAPSQSWFCLAEVTRHNLNAQAAAAFARFRADLLRNKETRPDTFVFQRFYQLGYFDDLLPLASNITIISHSNLSELIQKRFNVQAVSHVQIPGHQTFMPSARAQFPKIYKEILASLKVNGPRHIFLVAAGYLGKHYCHLLRSMGGVALDIGSLFDGWSGRGRVDAASNVGLRL